MTPSLASHCWGLFNFCSPLSDRTKEVAKCSYEQEQNTLQWRTFTVTLSTLQEKGDFNGGRGRIQTPAFSTRTEHKHDGRSFTRYPVNASENGDFNRGRKSFLANTMLKILTRATEKTKRSWTYMRENGVDSPYLFLH